MNIADEMLDHTVRHQVGIEGYKRRVVGEILRMVQGVHDKAALRLIKKDIQSLGVRDLSRLLKVVDRDIKNGYKPIISKITKELKDIAPFEAGFQADMFRSTIPVAVDFVAPATAQIFAAASARPFNGFLLKDWLSDLDVKAATEIKRVIREGFTDGRTTQQIVRTITGTRTTNGVATISKRKAEATVRTAINHTASVARDEVYKENSNIVDRVQWVSTLDGRTSAICQSRDGKTWPMNEGPRPPAHINCRSSTIPVVKSWKQLGINLKEAPIGTRASMDGQVSADLTYQEWLKKKPAKFQDEVLGRTKGKLFRDGMPIDKFVSRAGTERTLDQLKAANAEAFSNI